MGVDVDAAGSGSVPQLLHEVVWPVISSKDNGEPHPVQKGMVHATLDSLSVLVSRVLLNLEI